MNTSVVQGLEAEHAQEVAAFMQRMRSEGRLATEDCIKELLALEARFFCELYRGLLMDVNRRRGSLPEDEGDISLQESVAVIEKACADHVRRYSEICFGSYTSPAAAWMYTSFLKKVRQLKPIIRRETKSRMDEKSQSVPVSFHIIGNVNSVNFGTIIGNIGQGLQKIPDVDAQEAISKLQAAIVAATQSDDWKKGMLEPLEYLVDQAQRKPEERRTSVIKPLLDHLKGGLAVTADLVTLVPLVIKLATFFGTSLS